MPVVPPDHPDTDLLAQLVSCYWVAAAAARAVGRDPDRLPACTRLPARYRGGYAAGKYSNRARSMNMRPANSASSPAHPAATLA